MKNKKMVSISLIIILFNFIIFSSERHYDSDGSLNSVDTMQAIISVVKEIIDEDENNSGVIIYKNTQNIQSNKDTQTELEIPEFFVETVQRQEAWIDILNKDIGNFGNALCMLKNNAENFKNHKNNVESSKNYWKTVFCLGINTLFFKKKTVLKKNLDENDLFLDKESLTKQEFIEEEIEFLKKYKNIESSCSKNSFNNLKLLNTNNTDIKNKILYKKKLQFDIDNLKKNNITIESQINRLNKEKRLYQAVTTLTTVAAIAAATVYYYKE